MKRRYRIVHLSDIHFGIVFNRQLWKSVKAAVEEAAPDLLIVSGDFVQSPFPLMLILARRELDRFCEQLNGIPWFVVPGNHDVAFWGNVRIWPFTRLFGAIFSPQIGERSWFKKYPSFSEFYDKNGITLRFCKRLGLYLKFILCLHWLRLFWRTSLREHLARHASRPVDIFGLDSNRSFFLAAGKVAKGQLVELGSNLRELNARRSAREALVHRIVVLHHHPLPIPYAAESMTSFEPFLVLRESGTLLNELCLHDVDLVLHGHRHLANFSRITYGGSPDGPMPIPVLSAASPTAKGHRNENSFNILDLYSNGRIAVTPVSFGGGVTIKGDSSAEQERFDAVGLRELKVRNFRRSLRILDLRCNEFRRTVRIGQLGEAQVCLSVDGLAATDGADIQEQEHIFSVDLGYVEPANIRLVDASPSVSIISCSPPDRASTSVVVKVAIPTLAKNVRIGYELQYDTCNNFRLSEWELRRPPSIDFEYTAVRVRYPWRRLRLAVELPPLLVKPNPVLRCYRPADYPNLPVNFRSNQVDAPAEWLLDSEVTEFEQRSLFEVGPNQWEAVIEFPLLGYKYAIEWAVKDIREQNVNKHVAGETEAIRQLATKYRDLRLTTVPLPPPQNGSLAYVLDLLLTEFSKRFRAPIANETLRACLFTFDSAAQVNPIVAVEEVTAGGQCTDDLRNWVMPYGGGVAGLSFKTAYPQIYYRPAVRLGAPVTGGYFALAAQNKLEGILAIPLYHPKIWGDLMKSRNAASDDIEFADLPSPHEIIGVLTFSSDSPGTGLGQFYNQQTTTRQKTRNIFEFNEIVQEACASIVNGLAREPPTI